MAWYWIVLVCVCGFCLLYTLLCYIVAVKVLNKATTPKAHTEEEARAMQASAEKIDFDEYDNVWKREPLEVDGVQGKVRGEFVPNSANDGKLRRKVAVISHGHSWNRINSVKYAKIFYDNGYDVVLYDHAYFGQSDGKFTTLGYYEHKDLSAVIDAALGRFGKNAFVVLHGESMGAATVLGVLADRKDIGAVVADCGFSRTMAYYREVCLQSVHLPGFPIVDFANVMSKRKFGYDFTKYNPIDAVAASDVPICFIHGLADKFIFPHNSEDMYKVSDNSLSELHIVPGAGHARSHMVAPEAYRQIVTAFLRKVENAEKID